jgi:hypothetical protein
MAEPFENPAVIGFVRKYEENDRKENAEVDVKGHIIQKAETKDTRGI